MQTAVRQRFGTQNVGYQTVEKIEVEKMPKYQSDFSVNGEHVSPNYVPSFTKKEEILGRIAFLTQYMEDLKAGRPVENICENAPYYLDPKNIAGMIEDEKSLLERGTEWMRINNMDDFFRECGI